MPALPSDLRLLSAQSIYVFDTIWSACHIISLSWVVEIGDELEPEFDELHEDVRAQILALTRLLQQFGPQLGRPRVDTLNRSRHAKYEGTAVQRGRW